MFRRHTPFRRTSRPATWRHRSRDSPDVPAEVAPNPLRQVRSDPAPAHPWGRFEQLLTDAAALNRAEVRTQLDALFRERDPLEFADDWLMPMLRTVGTAWEVGTLRVSAEHLISQEVRRQLRHRLDTPAAPGDPQVVVGTAPGVRHDIGALTFAFLLRHLDVHATPLSNAGEDVWVSTLRNTGSSHAILAVTLPTDAPATLELIAQMRIQLPGVQYLVGGAHEHEAPPWARPLGAHLATAARQVAADVRQSSDPAAHHPEQA